MASNTINDVAATLKFDNVTKLPLRYMYLANIEVSDLQPYTYTVSDRVQVVETVTSDGYETKNTANPGDAIMCGPNKETYVVRASKFNKQYIGMLTETVVPEQSPRRVAHYKGTETVEFMTSWGEQMVLKPGDFLVDECNGYFYRIAAKEYTQTYNISQNMR